ncbi:MAG: response regulator transcription factor [Woeseiaceae bacterium]|nr:response regulator transcription factor [Woeseiaceae bacterium]
MRSTKVLLADDHRIVAEGLRRLLASEFEVVDAVETGEQLLEAARKLRPDVIVTDISMPRISGLDALARLKRDDPNIKVVLLTMHQNVAYAREALQGGALGFVLKHSAVEELVFAIRAAMAGRVFVSPEIAGAVFQATQSGEAESLDPFDKLSARQREILRLVVEGHSAKVIAGRLDISPRTVETHKYKIMEALELANSAELIRFAMRHGL